MSKKQDPSARIGELASILKLSHRKTTDEDTPLTTPPPLPVPEKTLAPKAEVSKEVTPPSPAPLKGPRGKSSDKANYKFKGLYLRRDTQKKVKRRLEDLDAGQDFSELVEGLLVKWLEETS